ncbi:hypothetical protein ASG07_09695 [Sphingomonas sp. Leaf343]|nr:hypothetical protein ASG07_09695 [Sphingomonas sp. Leaf343]
MTRIMAIPGRQVWSVLALAGLLLVAAFGAAAAWRIATALPAVPDQAGSLPTAIAPSALRIVVDADRHAESAAPASGVTGTTALPMLPAGVRPGDPGEVGVVAARPFSLGRASAVDRGRAVQCLANAIYYEAASEPDAGQRAVAQVVLNRVRHPAFPATVCGVVYQGSEKAGCQFSFACDGAAARVPEAKAMLRATRVAAAALAGYVYAPVGLATHYHTYAVTPTWNRALVMTDMVGAHFFHRWKGYWGTARAFSQSYRGSEPEVGSHAPVVPTLPAVASPVAVPAARPAVVPMPEVLPQSGQVLERWKDSGKPLTP